MTRMTLLSDEMWARVEPLLPPVKGAMGRPMREHRYLVEGAIYRYRTGVAWRDLDRKSTRLNSSHLVISYAVFCLEKKYSRMNSSHLVLSHTAFWLKKKIRHIT